jgi:uncharacterized membrane protein required for colicin V production
VVDLVIFAAVALAAFVGWRRGFIAPLFAVAITMLGLYALYAGPAAGTVPTGAAGIGLGVIVAAVAARYVMSFGSRLVAIVHRVGFLQKIDHVLGVPMGAVTGILAIYLALVAVVSFDNMIAPLHGKATVDQAAVAAMRAAVAANPQFTVMIDPSMLDTLAKQVATSAVPADQLEKFDQTLAFYESTVRPQLLTSVVAPILLGVGERVPLLGRHVVFPTK